MALALDALLDVLRAIGEQTRLRIVLLLRHGELTVTDLTDILGQSQPRISRHLKVLADAGVVDKHREGNRIYFELTAHGPISDLVAEVAARADRHDPVEAADLDRLALVHARRATTAQAYFADIAERWDELRALHAADEIVEAAIVDAARAGDRAHRSIADLGTGTGRMLQLLMTPSVERAVGLDNSHSMLAVARANFERAELRGIELRQGDVYSPPLEPGAFDLAIIHQVLHFLDDPARAVREAARLLAPGGRLVIVDFAPHSLEFLRSEHAHVRLGLRADAVAAWLDDAGLDLVTAESIDRTEAPGDDEVEHLTVSIWVADRPLVAASDTDARTPAEATS